MIDFPSGAVTFYFTDTERSTHLWQEQPEAISVAHKQYETIFRQAIESKYGCIFQIASDLFSAGFRIQSPATLRSLRECYAIAEAGDPEPSQNKGLRAQGVVRLMLTRPMVPPNKEYTTLKPIPSKQLCLVLPARGYRERHRAFPKVRGSCRTPLGTA